MKAMLKEGKRLERSATKSVARILSNRVSPEQLQPGDHVYSWRRAYSYAHHGIYVDNGRVIHFTRGEGQDLGILDNFKSSAGSVPAYTDTPCEECGVSSKSNGVVYSCMKCFLCGHPLYRYDYGKNIISFLLKARGGTCTLALSDQPESVLHRANYLFQNGFRCYNIFQSNCEDFAMYCKTGLLIVKGNVIGAGGQTVTVVGAPLAAVVSSPVLIASPLGMVAVTVGMYCLSRYCADVSNRPGAAKIPVEELVEGLSPQVLAAQHS